MPSDGEDKAVMDEFWARIQKKPFADKCYRENFVSSICASSGAELTVE